jgi:hypothetical protein
MPGEEAIVRRYFLDLGKERRTMRALPIGLMVLGFMGIALVGITSPAPPVNKVVIGVLDFETSGPVSRHLGRMKKAMMKELKQNRRVRLVNIRESCGLSDLKRNGRKREEKKRPP